jgi:hypothetical protein
MKGRYHHYHQHPHHHQLFVFLVSFFFNLESLGKTVSDELVYLVHAT